MNLEDYIVLGTAIAILGIASIYLFLHPSEGVFLSWCGVTSTVTGIYHYISFRDDKTPDA